MKKRGVLLATVLVIGMGMSLPAWAEEAPAHADEGIGGLLSSLFAEDGAISSLLKDEKAQEAISGLFGEGGALEDVLPEDVDIESVLQEVGSQLGDAGSSLNQGISSIVDMVTDEEGSIDWEKAGGSVKDLIGLFAAGGMTGEETGEEAGEQDWEAIIAELMIPYEKADEVMFAYLAERNAETMDTGDAQVFSKTTGYMDDPEQDVVKVLGDFTQANFTIDGDQMNLVSSVTETLLLTLTKGEDGTYTVTDEKCAEAGEDYEASLAALCEEAGTEVDDFYAGSVFGARNDATALAEYLNEHPEIATAEYQGEQMTAEELQALADKYSDDLMNSIFGEDEEEGITEAVTE